MHGCGARAGVDAEFAIPESLKVPRARVRRRRTIITAPAARARTTDSADRFGGCTKAEEGARQDAEVLAQDKNVWLCA